MERCVVLIDAGYLNAVLKRYGEPSIDYEKLFERVAERTGSRRLRTYFYDCLPEGGRSAEDNERLARRQRFHTRIRRMPRTEVKLGRLQKIGDTFRQKKVDVLLATDLVALSAQNRVHHVALIAGDSDFVPAIERAKQFGTLVHLFTADGTTHTELLDGADERHSIDKEFLDSLRREE